MALNENPEPQGTLPRGPRLVPPLALGPTHAQGNDSHEQHQEALRRAQQGDQDAFRWLVETNQKKVFGLVTRMLNCDRHTAADISQEVFLRAFRALQDFDGRALFSTWLHKITMNLCISEYRRRRAQKRDRRTQSIDAPIQGCDDLKIDPPSRELEPVDRVHHMDISKAVKIAVDKLPEDFRQCVLLRDMQGLSYEEVGEILNLPPGTVRSRIHRGRLILQRSLKEYMP